jgi:hypothetical protein
LGRERADGKPRRADALTPALWATRWCGEATALFENELAAVAMSGLDAQSLVVTSCRTFDMRQVLGDFVLRDPHDLRKVSKRQRKIAAKCFAQLFSDRPRHG